MPDYLRLILVWTAIVGPVMAVEALSPSAERLILHGVLGSWAFIIASWIVLR